MTVAKADGVSPEVLRLQLMKANQRVEVAGAQLAALKAARIKDDPSQLNLLERVAWALCAAQAASQAVQSVAFDPTGHHIPHPNDRALPGSSTKRARKAWAKLERSLEMALDEWEEARERDFMGVKPGDQGYIPRVRCGKRGCSHYDVPVPAWDRRGRAKEFCTGCSERMPAPVEKRQ